MEGLLADGLTLAQIGARVGRDPSTVGYWLKKHGLRAVNSERHKPRGGIALDDLGPLIRAGMSHRAIADQLGVSQSTVRHWVRRYGLISRRSARLLAGAKLGASRPNRVTLVCHRHGEVEHRLKANGCYRCPKCSSEAVSRRRRRVKAVLVEEAGGKCVVCGYDRWVGALEFHHVNPRKKSFALSQAGVTRSIAAAREEAAKCVLLCANCHAETEAGIVDRSALGVRPDATSVADPG